MAAWYYCSNRNYRKLLRSIYFDADYYRRNYSDVAATGVDPLVHYMTRGYSEKRQPCALFDSEYYLRQLPELKGTDTEPLQHFLASGWKGGHSPNPYFQTKFYIKNRPESDFSQVNPLLDYLAQGRDFAASIYFDAGYYRERYGDVGACAEHPLLHYLRVGEQEQRQASLFFDIAYYVDKAPGLKALDMSPLKHYFYFGMEEGKSPNPLFDPAYYRQRTEIPKDLDLLEHYLQTGEQTGQRPCSWFDPAFYRKHYLQDDTTKTPMAHYLSGGVYDGLYPSAEVADLLQKPIVSILVPVYNPSPAHLNNCIRSVLYQSYPHWELCLADDCSTDSGVRALLERWAQHDSRIKITFLDENVGISGATNAAASLASGEYVGFLDNDDELSNISLFSVVEQINREAADLYYSDEDLIGEDGLQFSVFYKPGFNKELLLSHNYVTHFVVTRRSLFDKIGGLDQDLSGAQDFDLFLKLSECARKVVHIPQILYHWRASESSTSINHDQKQYADEAGRRAVAGAMARRGIAADVELTDWKFFYQIRRQRSYCPAVSVIILAGQDEEFSSWFSRLVEITTYSEVEYIVVGDHGSGDLFLHEKVGEVQLRLLDVSSAAPCATKYNEAVRHSDGTFVIFLNNRVEIQTDEWIEALLDRAMDTKSAMVGGRILSEAEDEFVSQIPDCTNRSDLYYARFLQRCSQHMNGLQCAQNVMAMSWDMTMIDKACFLDFHGFDEEDFPSLFADSDLCFRLRERGFESVYTPFAQGRWRHSEEEQQVCRNDKTPREKMAFQKRWRHLLQKGDPYFNYGLLDQHGIHRDRFLNWYAGSEAE
jgi:GT2 family glycosyltransferase